MECFTASVCGDGADENREGDAAVDIAVLVIGLLFSGGNGGDACGGCRFDDGVKVESDGGGGLLAEVGEVAGGMAFLPLHAGDELADFHLWGDGVDVDDIFGMGFGCIEAGTEGEGDAKAVGTAAGKLNYGQRAAGEEQGGIVDADGAVFVHEMVFVESRKIVSFGHAVFVCFLGEAALQDGAIEGRRGLPRLEECPLAQLGLRLAVVIFSRKLA